MRRVVWLTASIGLCVLAWTLLSPTGYARPASCPSFRSAVQTMSDPGASAVRTQTRTTVSGLRSMKTRKVGAGTPRLSGIERTVYAVDARLVSALRTSAGIQLVVADPNTKQSLTVSFPDPGCPMIARSPRHHDILGAQQVFLAQCGLLGVDQRTPLRGQVTLSGIGFLTQRARGKKRAPGQLQLSPVISFGASAGCESNLDGVLLAAGDIATSYSQEDEATARILDRLPGTVATLGDNAYDQGTPSQFATQYAPTWGRLLARTRPAPGNHEYQTPGAAGYFSYFGSAAGDPSKGYYSYDLASWHIVVLNSQCGAIGGCSPGSPMVRWLEQDLAGRTGCSLAYWHVPRFSSGMIGSNSWIQDLWQALYNAGVDVVLNGHDHDYERFAPQSPAAAPDPTRGIREFVVGTGGAGLLPVGRPLANSEVLNNRTHGILKLTLHPGSYDWQFIPVTGETFTDSGSGRCH